MEYTIHPDFRLLAAIHPPLNRKTIPIIQKAMGMLFYQQRSSRTVRVERVRIPTETGYALRALLYIPKEEVTAGSILYCFVLPWRRVCVPRRTLSVQAGPHVCRTGWLSGVVPGLPAGTAAPFSGRCG